MSDFTIKGHVTLIDNKTNKALFDGDNMILKAGRKIFFDFFYKTLLAQKDSAIKDANYIGAMFPDSETDRIETIFFGINDKATTPSYNLIDNGFVGKNISAEIVETINPLEISWGIEEADTDNERYYIKFEKNITSKFLEQLNYIKEVGLILSDGRPFSRILLPLIPIEDDSDFTLIYYIYM